VGDISNLKSKAQDPNTMTGSSESPNKSKKGKRLSVERIYQKKTQREHILLRPDSYIGSTENAVKSMWIWNEDSRAIVMKEISYNPGLYKIFDEILVNAADNKQRDPSMNQIKITIDADKNLISIWNNGKGIPIEIHKEQNVYVPTLIFGHLLTSSNYDDSQKKVTGGRNGFGAKLCNIFSKKFVVETACSDYGKKFKQVWKDNMTKTNDASITDFKGTDFTCITFQPDLSRFHMEKLTDDMISLLQRRAYDVVGSSRGVNVLLNGEKLKVKNFKDYVDLYLRGIKNSEGEQPKIVHEICNPRWEICVTVSDNGFQQASFVNSIATTKGGTHVGYIVDQMVSKMMTAVKKKASKELNIKPFQIKNHLWVFVNCLIENPSFDSQTKENMTLSQKSFGSTCELSEKFIKSVQGCGVMDSIMNWVKFKTQEKLNSKCSATKRTKLKGIAKLDDANDAGGAKSRDCTLILTEGDSAKTLAISGLGIVGRDKYGVFPLRGKLLNVREATSKQIMENAEINNVVKIMGLQYKKKYQNESDLKTLRYGRLMIMTDQDQDGSHIKGLLINFIHHNWPSLLQMSFLEEFITPIVKVSKGGQCYSFFSLPEFEEWKQNTPNSKSWKIKYYKGLGTSTSKEAKEYFSDMRRHRILFDYDGPSSDQAIELAFSKKMIANRKDWLTAGMEERTRRRELGMPEIYLYGKDTQSVTYTDFVNKELILFSNADNERSIPSIVDGLKPGQRKVLFTCFKRNDKREIKVAQLAGSIAELSAYHHGETSLMGTIVNLAQNYVGSNNINLLQPIGQFGTRINGGKDSASPRYIFTMLSPLARTIFPATDDPLLKDNFEDGMKIEPEWYCPIIPMVLVNGAEGIGTGWSTKIPNFNPREIVENIKRLIAGEALQPMAPWYKNFCGNIEQVEPNKYNCYGVCDVIDNHAVRITELPVKSWTSNYKESVLEPYLHGTEKSKPCISDYRDCSTDKKVDFVVSMQENDLAKAEQEGLVKKFKLESSISLTSMVLFDSNGVLRKYETAEDILKEFFDTRRRKYRERKTFLRGMLEAEASRLENQARFIVEKIEGKIAIENRSKRDLIAMLVENGYSSDPVKAWRKSIAKEDLFEDDSGEGSSVVSSESAGPDFNYILNMNLWSLSKEKKEALLAERDSKKEELASLLKKSPEDLWLHDLDVFLEKLDEIEALEESDDREAARNAKSSRHTTVKRVVKNDSKKKKINPKITKPEKEKKRIFDEEKAADDDDDRSSTTTTSDLLSFADRVAQKRAFGEKKQSTLDFGGRKKKITKLSLSSDDDTDNNNDDDSDTDFIPAKRSAPSKPKLSSFEKNVDSDSENSEVERTKALIKKLTPVKQTTASASFQKKSGENDGKQAKAQKAGRKRKPVYRITDDESDEEINEPSSKKTVQETKKNQPKPKRNEPKQKGLKKGGSKKKVFEDSDNDLFEVSQDSPGPSKPSRSRATRGAKITYKFDDSDEEDGNDNSCYQGQSDDYDDDSDF